MNAKYPGFLDELASGLRPGVFMDDTGSPGTITSPGGPHPQRKTWVSVVVPSAHIAKVMAEFGPTLEEIRESVGASEFHFADIYGGRAEFEGVPTDVRLALFEFMAWVVATHDLPIFVQTFNPENWNTLLSSMTLVSETGSRDINLNDHKFAALLFALIRTKWYLEQTAQRVPARVFVDKGLRSDGVILELPALASAFADGMICFTDSRSIPLIQLADFAAFSLNRMQILAARAEMSDFDRTLLTILSPIAKNYRNIQQVSIPLDAWSPKKQN